MSKQTEDLKRLNDISSRIIFCRNHLKLKRNDIAQATGIKPIALFERENGVRTQAYEEFQFLAEFFNSKWHGSPEYKGVKITKITASWLMLGVFE